MDFTLTFIYSRVLIAKLDGMSCIQEISTISNENSVIFMVNMLEADQRIVKIHFSWILLVNI